MHDPTQRRDTSAPIKYGAVSWWLTVACVILLAVVALCGSVLGLLYRADAHVALGNAKTVRMALYAASVEAYGENRPFADPAHEGGVTEAVYADVLTACKVPGDFEVLRMAEDGYTVLKMMYTEGDFTVMYTADPVTWEVSVGVNLIHAAAEP